jgi:hypothetical protein
LLGQVLPFVASSLGVSRPLCNSFQPPPDTPKAILLRELPTCGTNAAHTPRINPQMTLPPALKVVSRNLFAFMLALAAFVVIAKALVAGQNMHENFALMGNDDIMRLLSVRDLIAGQSWFDTTQYRMIPPDGVSIHWSRYVDAGIAAIILPLSAFVPMDTAEQLAATIWPTLIMLVTLCVVGFGTRRVFGVVPAVVAMMCLVVWPLTAEVHATAGNLDHHNVQLLLLFTLIFAVIWPTRSVMSGVVGGLAGAFSLAVGLEALLFIASAGLILVVQNARGVPDARRHLFGFSAALGLGSILFWLGQAAPATRLLQVCDQLGVPILSLVWMAVISSLVPLAFGGRVAGFMGFAVTAVLTGLGLLLIWPLLSTCFDGPYGNLPVELRDYISASIVEAKPAVAYAKDFPVPAIIFTVPVIAALILGFARWRQVIGTPQADPLGVLLVFCAIGFAVILYQMRTVIMVAAVIPTIGGVVVAGMLAQYLKERDAVRGLATIVAAVAFVAPMLFAQALQPILPKPQDSSATSSAQCRTYAALQSLNAVPPSLILSHGNFGGSLIWATHHDALGGPYHRSAAALTNGALAFGMEEDALRLHVLSTGADHLLLCRDAAYRSAFLTGLAAGDAVDWLRPVLVPNENQLLFAVVRE